MASNGKEEIELYNLYKHKIDLILMDLHMPIMDGYESAEIIRKTSSAVPIIAMTADVILGVKEKCEKSGIHHYISKPFDPEQFLKTIREIISENKNEALEEPGILDTAEGLKHIGGDVEIYQQVLTEYYNENQDTLDKLANAIEEKRYADVEQIVHKVKGSSGSIGAQSLYEVSSKLQKALEGKKEKKIDHLHKEFNRILGKLLEEITEYKH